MFLYYRELGSIMKVKVKTICDYLERGFVSRMVENLYCKKASTWLAASLDLSLNPGFFLITLCIGDDKNTLQGKKEPPGL